jgi:hypothetical protein
MHEIEPYYRWQEIYHPYHDEKSPFYGKPEDRIYFENAVYNYLIHPEWDYFGSETLYLKVLFADYEQGYAIIEFIGEWNDTLYNDIMFLKRDLIDMMINQGIQKYILIGENVFNFHAHEDDYYEEWFQDVEGGWIVAMGFQEFVYREWERRRLDYYINFGGSLEIENWRTLKPQMLCKLVDALVQKRLN